MRKSARASRGPWTYLVEINRPRGNDVRRSIGRWERNGLEAELIPHLTTVRIRRPRNMPIDTFKKLLRSELHPRRGSVMVFCGSNGKAFRCSNYGNSPGLFVREL